MAGKGANKESLYHGISEMSITVLFGNSTDITWIFLKLQGSLSEKNPE